MRKRNNSGSSKRNSKRKNLNPQQERYPGEVDDRPEQSIPSGEPKLTGRSHGHIIDDNGEPAGRPENMPQPPAQSEADKEQDWESGRHQAL